MTLAIDMGMDERGSRVTIDLEELLATRLLVQGNSGSGKSHLLRRLLEGSAPYVQQVVIDPEGDFVSLSEAYGHIAVDAAHYDLSGVARIAERAREHRASVVLNLEGLEVDQQLRCAATFLTALFEAPREHWFPVLTVVDEAQLFAPSAGGEMAEDARRASLSAMTNLMCRGRKRGLAGVIATQRLAKLAKNVAAEASNFLMGRTFLDIDMARASDLLGMERRQADAIRDLSRGEFLALGPAISRRPVSVRIGEVKTGAASISPKLTPLPNVAAPEMRELLFSPGAEQEAPPPPPPAPVAVEDILEQLNSPPFQAAPELRELSEEEENRIRQDLIAEVARSAERQPIAVLYQDYAVRCRRQGIQASESVAGFRNRLAFARAGIEPDEDWEGVLHLGMSLPEEMLAPFLRLARAAKHGETCPGDDELAALYGTSSPSRAKRMMNYIEEKNLIVSHTDLSGRLTVSFPHFGWSTAPASPDPVRKSPRIALKKPSPFKMS